MPTLDDVKRAVCDAIDRQSEKIVTVGETIRKSPELGFKEFKTAKLVEETMREIGLSPKSGLAITGVRAEARGKSEGPTFALLGELDGLVVTGHPVADPQTGAAHACGPQHARHLRVVAAGVRRARLRICHRMPGHHEPVELAQQREGGAVRLSARLAAYAGDGESALGPETDLPHGLLDQLRGLELLEAELGAFPDRLADGDDLLAVPIDGLADCALDVVQCGHHVSFDNASVIAGCCVRRAPGRPGTPSLRRPVSPRQGWRRSRPRLPLRPASPPAPEQV